MTFLYEGNEPLSMYCTSEQEKNIIHTVIVIFWAYASLVWVTKTGMGNHYEFRSYLLISQQKRYIRNKKLQTALCTCSI